MTSQDDSTCRWFYTDGYSQLSLTERQRVCMFIYKNLLPFSLLKKLPWTRINSFSNCLCDGSLFHARGTAVAKDPRPALILSAPDGVIISTKWDGASPYRQRRTIVHSLYSTRCLTGSQWRSCNRRSRDHVAMSRRPDERLIRFNTPSRQQ